mgnify:CR=1 FL=1
MRKLIGYSLLIISCLTWAVMPVIPFLSITVAQKACWATAVFVFAEVTWWLAMPLLGKEIVEYSKAAWRRVSGFFSGNIEPSEMNDLPFNDKKDT